MKRNLIAAKRAHQANHRLEGDVGFDVSTQPLSESEFRRSSRSSKDTCTARRPRTHCRRLTPSACPGRHTQTHIGHGPTSASGITTYPMGCTVRERMWSATFERYFCIMSERFSRQSHQYAHAMVKECVGGSSTSMPEKSRVPEQRPWIPHRVQKTYRFGTLSSGCLGGK